MRSAILFLIVAASLPAADTSPAGLRQMVRECLVNFDKTDKNMRGYEYAIKDEKKEIDSHGAAKTRLRVLRHDYVDGVGVNHLMARDGKPLTPEERRQNEDDLKKIVAARKAMTPEQREKQAAERRKRNADQESWYKEAPEALDFKIAGEETIDGRHVLVLAFSPHPGYHAKNIWGRVLEKMAGKMWMDAEENELVRADAALTGDVTIGWGLVARINQGSRFQIERVRMAPHVWLNQKQVDNYSARIVFKTVRGAETAEYSEFAARKDQAASAPQ